MGKRHGFLRVLMAGVLTLTLAACGAAPGPSNSAPASSSANSSSSAPAPTSTNALDVAAKAFSNKLSEPVDKSVVDKIPKPVSGFTGYQSAPGDWLKEPDTSPLKGKRVALSVMGLGQPFFLAIKGHWERFAKKYGFQLKVYDGKFDAGTVQKIVDDIIADKPDAVAFAPLDSDASVPQVRKMLDAGITVITYNVQPREVDAPRVFADDYTGSRLVGYNAGAYYKAKFGNKPALIGIVDLPQLPQVQDRKNGFLYGFLSQVPNAKIGQAVDGGGVIDKANPAATDLIQANPDMNVIFGINNDSALGTVAALKAAGKYSADWGVLASVDGSAPAMQELGNPGSPWKAESGYPPYDFSIAPFNLLGAAVEGKVTKNTQVVLSYPPIKPTPESIKQWLDVQYPSR